MSKEKRENSWAGIGGLLFVGCLMLGFAFGFYFGNVAIGMFAGLGVGFIAMGLGFYLARAR